MNNTQRIVVTEVHNFGGFFGGDTVTISAVPWPSGDETTLTIDEKALQNVSDRYLIAAEMVLQIEFTGERVDRAWLLGARDWDVLKPTLGDTAPADRLNGPQIRAYRCGACDLWLLGQPAGEGTDRLCGLCERSLNDDQPVNKASQTAT